MRRFLILLSALVLGAIVPGLASAQEFEMEQSIYTCERGVSLPVVFINPTELVTYAVASIEGKLVPMESQRTASGVLYGAVDNNDGYSLWFKDDKATLFYSASEDSAEEITLLSNCRAD